MYSLLQFVIKKTITTNKKTKLCDFIDKSCRLLIQCLNTIGGQQEKSTIKVIIYLLNLLNIITHYDFTYIPWCSFYHGYINKKPMVGTNIKSCKWHFWNIYNPYFLLKKSWYIIHFLELTTKKILQCLNFFHPYDFPNNTNYEINNVFFATDFTKLPSIVFTNIRYLKY
jgi:hypothetical protein